MIVSSAPGRCGIVGNPTDMYGGSVVSCSTVERAHCTLLESTELVIGVGDYMERINTAADLTLDGGPLDVPKAILTHFRLTPSKFKVRLLARSDVPEQAGLAGSTALVVAILGAVAGHLDLRMDSYTMAETARKIEFGIMGITCGFQDQHMAVFGGLNYMDFRGKERLTQDKNEPYATVEPLHDIVTELPVVVAHTGVTRNSGSVHKSIRSRWLEGDKDVVEGYERIAHLARLGKKALLAGNWKNLGKLMNENHAIQKNLGGSGPQNDLLIEAALENGALGAKLAGAGKGGTIIALTLEPDRTIRALKKAGADKILWPRPVEGLIVETTFQQQILAPVAEKAVGSARSKLESG